MKNTSLREDIFGTSVRPLLQLPFSVFVVLLAYYRNWRGAVRAFDILDETTQKRTLKLPL